MPDDRNGLDAPDAALVAAVNDDGEAPYDLDALAAEVGATRTLLEAVERAGLLVPHHLDPDGIARYSDADANAVRAGLTLLDAGLPLGELLDLARSTDAAIREVAAHAVEAFLRFVRDPVRGSAGSDDEAAQRLVTAYETMLPATERLVAHHLRRRLLAEAAERVAQESAAALGDTDGPAAADAAAAGDGGEPEAGA
jgi:DNA-binding transcriptional MerR regulator